MVVCSTRTRFATMVGIGKNAHRLFPCRNSLTALFPAIQIGPPLAQPGTWQKRRFPMQTISMRLSAISFAVVLGLAAWARTSPSLSETAPAALPFAPHADLLGQVDFFVERIEQSLSDPDQFDLAKQSRTIKDASTLAVLALVLGKHPEDFPEKSSMPALLKGAQALAAAEGNAASATKALADVKTAREGKSPGGELSWQRVASLPLLMKQVPLIHASLKRGTTPRRLSRQSEQSAGQAAALAAVAQASIYDDEYSGSTEAAAEWRRFCAEMRDAALDVNAAIHAQDQGRVDASMKQMLESCEGCHAKFR